MLAPFWYWLDIHVTKIFDELTAYKIIPDGDGYIIKTYKSTSLFKKEGPTFRSKKVIISAGVLETIKLLLKINV